MSTPSSTQDRPDQTVRGTWLASLPLLVPPVAWIATLGLSWLVQEFTCSAAVSAGVPVPVTELRTVLLVIGAVLLLATLVALLLSVRALRDGRPRGQAQLTHFLGLSGVISAVLFGLGIVFLMATPFLFMEVC